MADADTEKSQGKKKEETAVGSDEDTDEECEVLEESPCGRWQKRREEVNTYKHNYLKLKTLFFFPE